MISKNDVDTIVAKRLNRGQSQNQPAVLALNLKITYK